MVWTPPLSSGIAMCQSERKKQTTTYNEEEESAMNITTIGLDIAKKRFSGSRRGREWKSRVSQTTQAGSVMVN